MGSTSDLEPLLGLTLADAAARLEAAGTSTRLVRSVPPRPRIAFPPDAQWRVARARWADGAAELVIVPAVPLPEEAPPTP